jgi:hypothetical protein
VKFRVVLKLYLVRTLVEIAPIMLNYTMFLPNVNSSLFIIKCDLQLYLNFYFFTEKYNSLHKTGIFYWKFDIFYWKNNT